MGKFYSKKIDELWKSLDEDDKKAMLLFGKECADAAIRGFERGIKRGFALSVFGVTAGYAVYEWWKNRRNETPDNENEETDSV